MNFLVNYCYRDYMSIFTVAAFAANLYLYLLQGSATHEHRSLEILAVGKYKVKARRQ